MDIQKLSTPPSYQIALALGLDYTDVGPSWLPELHGRFIPRLKGVIDARGARPHLPALPPFDILRGMTMDIQCDFRNRWGPPGH